MGFGLYSGIVVPHTFDKGITKDPRYTSRYEVKFAPIGFTYSMDYEGFGFIISPGLVSIGQNFHVVNTSGGHNGLRKIDLQYLHVPAAFKLHLINLSFFRVSAIASIGAAFLIDGTEQISHSYSKLTFPKEVYPILPADYVIEYDGVIVPDLTNYTMLRKSDFKSVQYFAAAGIRTDWDISNHWRVSFDFRFNYGILDPRDNSYLERVRTHQTLYDIAGERTDMFGQLTVGISRFIDFDKNDKQRERNLKGNKKRYKPSKTPMRKPSRPRN